jgi:hypothetical protein
MIPNSHASRDARFDSHHRVSVHYAWQAPGAISGHSRGAHRDEANPVDGNAILNGPGFNAMLRRSNDQK